MLTYFNNGGLSILGWPSDNVHLLNSYEISGYSVYGSPACYIQNIRNSASGDPWVTLVLNPYVYNDRLKYLGIVFLVHGQIRNCWRVYYSQYGPPICNEYEDWVNGVKYIVQWFEPSDNVFKKIAYNTVTGTFNDAASSALVYGNHLNQSAWKNIGCTNGNCGVGGGGISPPDSFNVSVLGASSIQLSWVLPEGTNGYTVRIYRNGSVLAEQYITSYLLNNYYIVNNLAYGTRYCFQISLLDHTGIESSKSNEICMTTNTASYGPITAPSFLRLDGNPYQGAAKIIWPISGSDTAGSGVEVFRDDKLLVMIPGVSYSYTDTSDAGCGVHVYKVRAVEVYESETYRSAFSPELTVQIKVKKPTGLRIY